jgi:molybdate transport system substrate-binding protein
MLAAQIEQGLPADVFASANTALPWQLHRKGLVTRPVVFTSNRLVAVIAHGDPKHIGSVQGLEKPGLRIVMAAAGVPVGDYTRKVLARLGMSDLVGKAVSQETDVREVLAKVTLGEADAGFVYATDAKTVAGKVSLLGIQKSAQPQVLYAAAAVKASTHLQVAKAWVNKLLSKPAQTKLRAAGFLRIPH